MLVLFILPTSYSTHTGRTARQVAAIDTQSVCSGGSAPFNWEIWENLGAKSPKFYDPQ